MNDETVTKAWTKKRVKRVVVARNSNVDPPNKDSILQKIWIGFKVLGVSVPHGGFED